MGSKTYVSTVAYPLGNEKLEDEVDHLKFATLNALLTQQDLANTITQSYLKGPGIKFRAAYRYARDKYSLGLPHSQVVYNATPDREAVVAVLEAVAGGQVYLNMATLMVARFQFWAERYLAQTYGYDRLSGKFTRPPDGVEPMAAVTYDIERNGAIRILMMNADGFTTELTYYPKDLSSGQLYLHSIYQVVQDFPTEITTTVRPVEVGDTTGVTNSTDTLERDNVIQETTTKTTTSIAGTEFTTVVEKTVRTMSRPKYFLYRIGAGTYPSLDALQSGSVGTVSPFFPSIPLRVDNVDVSAESRKNTSLYKTSKKLLQYAGVDYEDIAEKLRDNKDIKEIDFAFVQFGVALNTELPAGKKYIYRFFEMMQNMSATSRAEVDAWVTEQTAVASEMATLAGDPEEGGTDVPNRGFTSSGYTSPSSNRLRIYDRESSTSALNIELEWSWAETTQHSGVVRTGARPGDCEVGVSGSYSEIPFFDGAYIDKSQLYARRQIDEDTYEEIRVAGFMFTNHVYKDKTVEISAYKALTDANEEGFILPLSYEIFHDMGMRDGTQLTYECMHMVLNCYKVVKKKWYQTGIFKLIVVIIAIVIVIVTWGAGSPAASGMVGAVYGVVAGVLGATFLAWVVANVIVGLALSLLMKILSPALVDLFGEKWGRVIAAVASIVISMYAGGGNMSSLKPTDAASFLRASTAVVQVGSAYMQGVVAEMDIPGSMKALTDEYTVKMDEIERLTREFLSPGSNLIDIQMYMKATEILMENPRDFFTRTLLTGTDIADITLGQIEYFSDVGLQLPNTG